MSKPIDPQAAIESLWKLAPQYAKAKAERIYIETFLKSKRALLMKQCGEAAIGAQEREALAHPDYIALVEALKTAVEAEETLKWRLTSSELACEIWRSQEASNRTIDRAAR